MATYACQNVVVAVVSLKWEQAIIFVSYVRIVITSFFYFASFIQKFSVEIEMFFIFILSYIFCKGLAWDLCFVHSPFIPEPGLKLTTPY